MPQPLELDALLKGCADDSFDDGIRIDSHLEPLSGPGGLVKPAVYEGGTYQHDQRWASPDDSGPTPVIVIDNVPSQANRLEEALRRNRGSTAIPELVIDLSALPNLPAHLPQSLSSLEFPHRNADAYLRDAELDGLDFLKTEIGRAIFDATAQTCGPLIAWFPQALLYGEGNASRVLREGGRTPPAGRTGHPTQSPRGVPVECRAAGRTDTRFAGASRGSGGLPRRIRLPRALPRGDGDAARCSERSLRSGPGRRYPHPCPAAGRRRCAGPHVRRLAGTRCVGDPLAVSGPPPLGDVPVAGWLRTDGPRGSGRLAAPAPVGLGEADFRGYRALQGRRPRPSPMHARPAARGPARSWVCAPGLRPRPLPGAAGHRLSTVWPCGCRPGPTAFSAGRPATRRLPSTSLSARASRRRWNREETRSVPGPQIHAAGGARREPG